MTKHAAAAVVCIVEDIRSREGLQKNWDKIERDTQMEICETWAAIIERVMEVEAGKTAKETRIRVGSIVRLRSGGPLMVVVSEISIDPPGATCAWNVEGSTGNGLIMVPLVCLEVCTGAVR